MLNLFGPEAKEPLKDTDKVYLVFNNLSGISKLPLHMYAKTRIFKSSHLYLPCKEKTSLFIYLFIS